MENFVLPGTRRIDTGPGQNAVTRGQWQLTLESVGALLPHRLSGEAKTILLHYNSAQCGEDLEVNMRFQLGISATFLFMFQTHPLISFDPQ